MRLLSIASNINTHKKTLPLKLTLSICAIRNMYIVQHTIFFSAHAHLIIWFWPERRRCFHSWFGHRRERIFIELGSWFTVWIDWIDLFGFGSSSGTSSVTVKSGSLQLASDSNSTNFLFCAFSIRKKCQVFSHWSHIFVLHKELLWKTISE